MKTKHNYSGKAPLQIVLVMFIGSLLATSCDDGDEAQNPPPALSSEKELIEKGKYLMVIGACHDCHSPKVMTHEGPMPDSSRLLSGHPKDDIVPPVPAGSQDWILFSGNLTAFVGPWGVSYAANLTPHETGTKHWTFEQFKVAIRKGKYKGLEAGRDLLPPMPWQMYRNMTDEDLKAIFTYLRSIKPIDNLVPQPVPSQTLVSTR